MKLEQIITETTENMLSEIMSQKVIITKWNNGIIYYKYENSDEVKSIKFLTLQKMWGNK